ncbi:MAG: lysostaphin resistance A-like protein [Propioniciclava sp.]
MAHFSLGIVIVLAWWVAWTTYIQYIRRTAQFQKFHSGVYDACTCGFAMLAIGLAIPGIAPFGAKQLTTSPASLGIGAVVGCGLWAAQALYIQLRTRTEGSSHGLARYPNRWPWMLPVTGAAEEVIFRGCLLFGLIAGGLPPIVALIIASTLFGLVHVFQFGLYGVVLHSLTGLAFGILAVELDLIAAVMAHSVFNLLVVVMSLRAPRRRARRSVASGVGGASSVD